MLFVAASTPDPVILAAFLGCVVFVLGGVNQSMKLVDRVRGQPPAEHLQISADELKRRVTEVEAAVKVSDNRRKALYDQIDKVRMEIKADVEAVNEKLSGVNTELRDEIGCLRSEITSNTTETRLLTQNLLRVEGKLDRMVERKS